MPNKPTYVYYASSLAEVLLRLKNISELTFAAGCTEIGRRQTGRTLYFPAQVLSLARIPELCAINKTERYLDFGAAVTLQSMLALGKKNLPEILYQATETVAHPGIRALATIGGNIAAKGHRLSLFAPLLALDAKLEIRTVQEAVWVPLSRYFSNTGKEGEKRAEIISKIRVPTDQWDISIYRRIGNMSVINDSSAFFAFLVKLQKNILADIRIAFTGKFFFRKREFENLMIGRSLPFTQKDIAVIMEKANAHIDPEMFPPSYERSCLLALLEESLRTLM